MKRFLFILFLLSAFLFYSYAGQEEEKGKVVIIDPDDTSMIENWPQWLFLHGYTSYYDSNWSTRRGSGAIVIRKPLSFGESFLDGLGKGISKGIDNYYRAREQKQDIEFKMGLLKLKWANEGYYSKPTKYSQPQRYFVPDREPPALWLGRQKEKARFSWLDKFPPKEKKGLDEFLRSEGWVSEWQYKTKKLNEYLKSLGLSLVPTNVDVNQVYDGDWIIFWDGEKWARKKKQMNYGGL